MIDFYPVINKPNWKNRLLSYELQYFESKRQQTENKILTLCAQPKNAALKRLNSESFWHELACGASDKNTIDELKNIWLKIKPFAHLNSRQLLSFLQDEVITLERYYQLSLKAYDSEKGLMNNNESWPWNKLYPSFEEKISLINKNQERLTHLKGAIFTGLYWRCQVHSLLNVSRETDDIVAAFSIKINSLNILKTPFQIESTPSKSLTDDLRVSIYDYLESSWPDKNELHHKVILPIPKQGHVAFKSAQEVNQELKECRKFYKKTYNALNPQSDIASYFGSITPGGVKKSIKYTLDGLKNILNELGVFSFLVHFWGVRYIAYLLISFGGYNYLHFIVKPLALTALGITGFAILDSLLFYGIAMLPVWALGWTILSSVKQFTFNTLTRRKKTEIYQTLDTILSIQEFIANNLSQVIIDLPKYEVETLSLRVQAYTAQLNSLKIALDRYNTVERWLCKGDIDVQINSVKLKIASQEAQLIHQFQQVATHIAQRIGEDIELLEKSPTSEQLQTIISHEQVNKLRAFVLRYGNEATLALYNENASPIRKWADKLDSFSYAQQNKSNSLAQPWGGHNPRADYIKGWDTILRGYLPDGVKREAALNINSLLLGKNVATPEQLQDWVNQLELAEKEPMVLQKIQMHIFKTLKPQLAQNAKLVSDRQKELIASWHSINQSEIAQAKVTIRQAFKAQQNNMQDTDIENLADCQLSKIYELLDGADIYANSSNQIEQAQSENLVRQYYLNYQGETSRAIRFLKFIPANETINHLVDIAHKRLTWILANLEDAKADKYFDDTDTELFLDYLLLETNDKFNFSSHVATSHKFNAPWDEKMESFLEACILNGFESGRLLKKYKENNTQVKQFIVSQKNRQNNLQSPGNSAKVTASLNTERRSKCSV